VLFFGVPEGEASCAVRKAMKRNEGGRRESIHGFPSQRKKILRRLFRERAAERKKGVLANLRRKKENPPQPAKAREWGSKTIEGQQFCPGTCAEGKGSVISSGGLSSRDFEKKVRPYSSGKTTKGEAGGGETAAFVMEDKTL